MKPSAADQTQRYGRVMIYLMWLAVLALLTAGFNHWLETQRNPNHRPSGVVGADGSREVTLQRNRHGHYLARGHINGQPVEFLLDTGASDVSIPAAVADRLGLERGAPRRYRTASGEITAYLTPLEQVEIGPVVVNQVRGSINPHMEGEQVLLGMSFLRDLELIQRADQLTLRQPAR